jgi:DNA-binding CsgD family transcriptional regulator
VILHDLAAEALPIRDHLRQLFGVTAAEADLAGALLSGRRLEEIASLRGVHITTLRSQLSALLAKTDTHRQSQLMGLLVGLSAKRHLKDFLPTES